MLPFLQMLSKGGDMLHLSSRHYSCTRLISTFFAMDPRTLRTKIFSLNGKPAGVQR